MKQDSFILFIYKLNYSDPSELSMDSNHSKLHKVLHCFTPEGVISIFELNKHLARNQSKNPSKAQSKTQSKDQLDIKFPYFDSLANLEKAAYFLAEVYAQEDVFLLEQERANQIINKHYERDQLKKALMDQSSQMKNLDVAQKRKSFLRKIFD